MKRMEVANWQRKKKWSRQLLWLVGGAAFIFISLVTVLAIILNHNPYIFSGPVGDSHLAEPQISGDTILVKSGESFQLALYRAKPGDTILLEPGSTFTGAFELPNKNGNEVITIRPSLPDSQLPPPGKRIDPKRFIRILPKLKSNVKGKPVISTAAGAHHFRFIAIEFMPTIDGLYDIVQIGKTDESRIEDLPHHIEFDRVYMYGDKNFGQRRGIAANGRFLKIENSHFSDFKREGEESQAIATWASDGHIEIINNYLEAAAESVLFGGAESKLRLIPADCLVKDNWMNKPIDWMGTKWVVKNFLEIKSGKRIKIENNLMTNNWAMAQEGTGLVFRTGEDSGKHATLEDIEVSNNIVRSSGSAINVYGGEGDGGRRLTVRNNLFYDIDSKKYDGRGFFFKVSDWNGLVVENNTVIHSGSITIAYGAPTLNFVFRNNIVFENEYGFFGDGGTLGKSTLTKYFSGAVLENNIIVGGSSKEYGPKNFYPSSIHKVGFMDAQNNNYRLGTGSPYLNQAAGKNPIGAVLDTRQVGGTK